MGQTSSLGALERYAEHTASSMVYIGLELVGVRDANAEEAASYVGRAQGVATYLRGLGPLLAAGRAELLPDLLHKVSRTGGCFPCLRPHCPPA